MHQIQSALIGDKEEKNYELLTTNQAPIFDHKRDSAAVSLMQDFCVGYMGKVLPAKLPTFYTDTTQDSAINPIMHAAIGTVNSTSDSMLKGDNQVGRLSAQNSEDASLQSISVDDKWRSDFAKKVAQLEEENNSLRHDLRSSLEKNAKFFSDFAVMQRDFMAVRDKNSILCQDMAAAEAEKNKLCEQQQAARTDVTGLQTCVADIQQAVSIENGKLQGENTEIWTCLVQLQKSVTDIQQDIPRLRSELSTQITGVKVDHTKLKSDLGSSKGQINTLQQQVSSLKNDVPAANTARVAFHVNLDKGVTTTTTRTLILKQVISSIGGGYDAETGIFTAPVTGIYLFMATASPNRRDDNAESRLDIVLENKVIGYLCASQLRSAAGHTVTRVNAGQKVWLRTFNQRSVFHAGWWTSFTGVLVQPE